MIWACEWIITQESPDEDRRLYEGRANGDRSLVSLGGPWLITSVAAQDDRANRVVLAGWIDATGSLRSMTSESPRHRGAAYYSLTMGKPAMRAPSNPKRPTPKIAPAVSKRQLDRERQKWRQKQRNRSEK